MQQINFKVTLPKPVMDIFTKSNLGWANTIQEEYRRNGKEVDKEARFAMAEVMRGRKGAPLTSDQKVRVARGVSNTLEI